MKGNRDATPLVFFCVKLSGPVLAEQLNVRDREIIRGVEITQGAEMRMKNRRMGKYILMKGKRSVNLKET